MALAVIVSYKTAELVKNLIVSLARERAAEAARGLELRAVVVDNASGDADAIEQAVSAGGYGGWVKVLRAPENGGFSYGNNLGFRYGFEQSEVPEFFFMLNPDTEVRPGSVRALVDFFDQHPDAGIAGSSLEFEDGSPWPYAFRYPSLLSELDYGLRLGFVTKLLRKRVVARLMGSVAEQVDWLPGAAMMVRRQVIERLGGLDQTYFLYYEETDFCLKVKKAGYTVWYVPESRVMHIAGQSTGVTGFQPVAKPLPDYWFESRRRYFAKNHGLAYAVATDAVLLASHALGQVKERFLKGSKRPGVPHFAKDIFRHSVFHQANRSVDPPVEWRPTMTSK
jgi:N-acetylglucosaminyl-diphospho-decaprenol L-rhamnosyltransferase